MTNTSFIMFLLAGSNCSVSPRISLTTVARREPDSVVGVVDSRVVVGGNFMKVALQSVFSSVCFEDTTLDFP